MPGAFLRTIHKVASVGWVYDSIQTLAGASFTQSRLQRSLSGCTGRVLDLGGGTGTMKGLLPPACAYTCLDNEMPKLQRCAMKAPGSALLGDATRMPVESGSIDVVTAVFVAHHLTSHQFEEMLRESARVLKPKGSFILMDAVWKPSRLPGRLLWALDRGSSPKSEVELHAALERHFRIEQWDHLAVYHQYIIAACRKNTALTASAPPR
jgi:ubiquinone/menaquinone biosynthesis C-methylase UbiE